MRSMRHRVPLPQSLLIVLALTLLTAPSCPSRTAPRANVVLVTVESLRADRLVGAPQSPDPLAGLRAVAGSRIRPLISSSSDTLPAMASLFTGTSPAVHRTLVEGVDRLPESLPTMATLLGKAGYRTAGFPTLGSLGLSSGLSQGFRTY